MAGSKTISTNCGLNLTATDTFHSLPARIHTLLVAGGTEVEKETHDKDLIAWLRQVSPRVQRLGSICIGAFLLASAGLLDGKRAATHWKWTEKLASVDQAFKTGNTPRANLCRSSLAQKWPSSSTPSPASPHVVEHEDDDEYVM